MTFEEDVTGSGGVSPQYLPNNGAVLSTPSKTCIKNYLPKNRVLFLNKISNIKI